MPTTKLNQVALSSPEMFCANPSCRHHVPMPSGFGSERLSLAHTSNGEVHTTHHEGWSVQEDETQKVFYCTTCANAIRHWLKLNVLATLNVKLESTLNE